jgi:subtilase family serine protease
MAGCLAGQALAAGHTNGADSFQPPFKAKVLGYRPNGERKLSSGGPTGLPPSVIASVYKLSGMSPSSGAGSGQIIAIVDAYRDPNALRDLNAWNAQYGYPALSTCSSLTQSGACFEQVDPQGTPAISSKWALEESLDIEWAHAEARQAKLLLVEAASSANSALFSAVQNANRIGATEVSMSWVSSEYTGETADDASMTHPGTLYTASSGDTGHAAMYPAASPNVIAVGGTTLVGCSGTSCRHFSSETAWSGSGGGTSSVETIPSFQSSYSGPVFGALSIATMTGKMRGVPDVSFDANPGTGVSVYDSTQYQGQAGWFTLGGTSVGAPNWAGILAAGRAASLTALQGDKAIFASGYKTNLRDITSGTNGNCGTACTAGPGYDLVTGLGSPLSYP